MNSSTTHNAPIKTAPLLGILLLLCIGTILGGIILYQKSIKVARSAAQKELSAIASYKVRRISRWKIERFRDAHIIMNSSLLKDAMEAVLRHTSSTKINETVLEYLNFFRSNEYSYIGLFDSLVIPVLTIANHWKLSKTAGKLIKHSLACNCFIFSDLYPRSPGSDSLVLGMFIPLSDTSSEPEHAVGVVAAEIDTRNFLLPLLEQWTSPNTTSETFLVQKTGDTVLILGE